MAGHLACVILQFASQAYFVTSAPPCFCTRATPAGSSSAWLAPTAVDCSEAADSIQIATLAIACVVPRRDQQLDGRNFDLWMQDRKPIATRKKRHGNVFRRGRCSGRLPRLCLPRPCAATVPWCFDPATRAHAQSFFPIAVNTRLPRSEEKMKSVKLPVETR
jgi:hypothetical protein